MLTHPRFQPSWPGLILPALVAGLVVAVSMAGPTGAASDRTNLKVQPPAAPQAATEPAFEVRDTPANLQTAFSNEINAKERYAAFAKQADREGCTEAARLFRACAIAEEAHSHLHTQAIAWTYSGAPARAVLQRFTLGTTAENLRAAIETEKFEMTRFYPALLARAHADDQPMAVRSINLALAAEREHAALLEQALQHLDRPLGVAAFYVCPYCGKTVEARDFGKCPSCFTAAAKFVRVT